MFSAACNLLYSERLQVGSDLFVRNYSLGVKFLMQNKHCVYSTFSVVGQFLHVYSEYPAQKGLIQKHYTTDRIRFLQAGYLLYGVTQKNHALWIITLHLLITFCNFWKFLYRYTQQ